MGATAALAMVGGAALNAYGQYQAGKHNQQIANYNAKVNELQAQDALTRGRERETRHRQDVRGLIGQQRASLAAQGVAVDSGTALALQEEAAYFGELDAQTLRHNAAMEAWGYRVGAENQRMQGELAYAEGRNRAFSTLLSSGGQAAMQYRNATGG